MENKKNKFWIRGHKSWGLGLKAEKEIEKLLPNYILCRNIDLIWRGLKIEVKATTKNIGNSFLFKCPNNNPDVVIFVAFAKDYETIKHIWLINKKDFKDVKMGFRTSFNINKKPTAKYLVKNHNMLNNLILR